MKSVKIISTSLIIILLFGIIFMQGSRKIGYLSASDEISLRFINSNHLNSLNNMILYNVLIYLSNDVIITNKRLFGDASI